MIVAIHIAVSSLILFGVSVIIFTKNIAHAAYAFALTLIAVAAMYVLLNAELLAVVQILVYAGGVVILLSFGVMLTNRMGGEKLVSKSGNKILGAIISLIIFLGLSLLIRMLDFSGIEPEEPEEVIEKIGISFLTRHIVAFELIAFILLVALVGSAYLAKMSSDE